MITTDQFTISVINDGAPGGTGPTGPAGATVSSERDQYYYSTSNTSLTGGSWSYTPTTPIPNGKFLWTRREITMSDSTVKYSNAVYNSTMQNVIFDVNRLNGEITSKVEQADITNSINSYDNTTVSAIRNRVTQTEQDISGITSRVTDVETISDDLGTRMTTAESNISQNADNIELKVSKDGVISSINQSSESIQINANKVNINGAVTFSSFNNDLQSRFTTAETDSSDAKSIASTANTTAGQANQTAIAANNTASQANQTATAANNTAIAADGKATTANNWITTNGSGVLTAKDIISNWAEDATSATTTIKGGLITTNTITADQLATDAIMSNNYVAPTASTTPFSSDGSFFDLSNGDIVTPSFTVDHDGIAKLGDNNSYISFDKTTGQLSAKVSSISIGSNAVATQSDVSTAVGNMKMQYLVISHAAIQKNISGVYNPTSITLTAKQQAGDGAVSDYTGRFKVETTTNNSTWTPQYTTGDVSSYTYTIPANIIAVRCSLYKQGGLTTLLDQQTLPIVSDGAKGDPGQTGTSVSITGQSVEYKEGTSGTQAPTGDWSLSIPSVAPGNYLWTKTIVNYSDGNSTTAYSVAREGVNGTNGTNGQNGTSPTVSSTDQKYAQTTNGTTPPASSSSDWKTSPPTATAGQYMWTKTTVTYSDGATSESYTVSKNGTNGGNGINTATVYLYQRATSQPSKPSTTLTYTFSTCALSGTLDSWQQSVPTGTNPCWVTFATASGTGTTDTIASTEWTTPIKLEGVDGQNGQPGTNGYNSATIFLYQRSASVPSKPSTSTEYTFSTGALSQVPTNWSRTVPTNNGNPCYVTTATAFSNTATDTISSTDWSDVVKLVEDGEKGDTGVGISSVTELYYCSDSSTIPAKPTAHVTTPNQTYNRWNPQCPTWTSVYQYYYTCQEILYNDGTYSWSDVVANNGYSTANSTASAANKTATDTNKALKVYNGACSTARNVSDKVVTCSDTNFQLIVGARITVRFTLGSNANTLSLNVNDTGSIGVYYNRNTVSSSNIFKFGDNTIVEFRYSGAYWVVERYESSGYLVSQTAANNVSKVVSMSTDGTFVLCNGTKINVYFLNANISSNPLYLNVCNTGLYKVSYKGADITSANPYNWFAKTTIQFVFHDACWYLSDSGAKEAEKTATNYLYYDSTNGLVIHQSDSEISGVSDLTGNVGNVRITGDGMDIYRGQTKTASYGSEVVIGPSILSSESPSNIRINTNGFQYNNAGDEAFYVGVEQRVVEMSEESTQNAVRPEDSIDTIAPNREYVYVGDIPEDELRLTKEIDPDIPEEVFVCDTYTSSYNISDGTMYWVTTLPHSPSHLTLRQLKPNSVVRTSDGTPLFYRYVFANPEYDHDELWVKNDYHITYTMVTYKPEYIFAHGATFKVLQKSTINPKYYDLLKYQIDNDFRVWAILNNTNDAVFAYRDDSEIIQIDELNYFKTLSTSGSNYPFKEQLLDDDIGDTRDYDDTTIIDGVTYYKIAEGDRKNSRTDRITKNNNMETTIIDGVTYYKFNEYPIYFSQFEVLSRDNTTYGDSVQFHIETKQDKLEMWIIAGYTEVKIEMITNDKILECNVNYRDNNPTPIDHHIEMIENKWVLWVTDFHNIHFEIIEEWEHIGVENGVMRIVNGIIYSSHYKDYIYNYDTGKSTYSDYAMLQAASDTVVSSTTFIERAELDTRIYYKVYNIPENVIVKSVVKSSDHSIAEYYIQDNGLWVAGDFNVIYTIAYVGDTTSPYFVFGPNNYSSALPAGKYSFAAGEYCSAQGSDQFVIGKYNKRKTSPAFIIGNGKADNNRSNALEIDWYGNVMTYGSLYSENDDITPAEVNNYVFR